MMLGVNVRVDVYSQVFAPQEPVSIAAHVLISDLTIFIELRL